MKVYILLDRSGSMADKWDETLSALNGYVTDLAANGTDAAVTLAMFDFHSTVSFDVIRRNVAPKDWNPVAVIEANPRGYTPLFDAVGKIVTMADEDAPDKAVIVVLTDGMENASRELTKEAAKALLERCRAKGWQDVFLGADFDAFGQAGSLGVSPQSTLNATKGNYRSATSSLAAATQSFGASGQAVNFSDEDRKGAVGGNQEGASGGK